MDLIQNIDFSILYWIQDTLRCAFLDVILPFLTTLCNNGEIWIVCGIVLLFFKKYRRYGIFVLVAMLLGSLIGNEILKPIIARARPCHIDTAVELLVERPSSFSFPSGHTATAFMGATLLAHEYGHKSVWIPIAGYSVATATGVLRILNNKHYASDVLVGAAIGIVSAELAYWATDAIFNDRKLFKSRRARIHYEALKNY